MGKIKKYITQIRGVSYKPSDSSDFQKDGYIPILRANNIRDGKINFDKLVYVKKEKVKVEQYLRKGDILVCTSSGSKELVGKSALIIEDLQYSFGAFCKVIRTNNELAPNYLSKYFQSNKYKNIISKSSNGANINNLRAEDFDNLELEIIPYDSQLKVSNKLEKVIELVELKKSQIEELDNLIKSQFVEMFGDPINNQKGFPLIKVGDVFEFEGGSQPDKKYFEYQPSEDNIRLIQIRDYKSNDYITYIPKEKAKRFCTANDIMIGRYGPPIFQILKGIEGAYNVALMKAVPKKGNIEFLRQFLKQECLLHYLEGLSGRTAGQAGIEMPKLKNYPFPYPPLELQNQFANFVEHIDKLEFVKIMKRDSATKTGVCRKVCVNCHNPFYVKNQKLVIDQN